MFEGFLHPGLAAGAALAAVPLVIHLMNRQRHKPLEWAAMRFVMAAYKKTRRRSQLENLLLLLLRMAAVALLALAVARPYIGRDSVLAPLTESRRHVAVLIDASASMGYREQVETVFERSVERARELLKTLDGARGDRARLVLVGATPRLLSARSPEDALAALSTLTSPTAEVADLGVALGEVARWAEEDSASDGSLLEVRLLTDMQRSLFTPRLPTEDGSRDESTPALFAALDKLNALGVQVTVEDHGPAPIDPPNLAIEAVETFGASLGPGATVEVGVTLASFGPAGAASARIVLEVDGERQPSQNVDLTARSRAEVIFPLVFPEPGLHTVTARLEGDAFPIDDARDQVIEVPPALRVLMVNGDPAEDISEDEVGYIRAVLEPPDEADIPGSLAAAGNSPFRPTEVTDLGLIGGEVDLTDFDVILLANTSPPTPRIAERLEARVAGGAALIITAGDRVAEQRETWNARLLRPDGSGLLPAHLGPLVDVGDRRLNYFRAKEFKAEHPALAFFADERWRPLLTEVPVWAFLAAEPQENATTLVRLDDVGAHPLLLERPYDRGRVFLWTSTLDKAWTKLPESPRTLVPLVHELLRYARAGKHAPRNVQVGAALVGEVGTFPRELAVVRPDGQRRPLDGEPVELAEGLWQLPAVTHTDQVGLWTIERAGAPNLPFSVQLDPLESDLLRMSLDEVESLHPALLAPDPGSTAAEAGDDPESPSRGELWRWLALFCLAALVAESLWAAWIGRRRRIA